MDLLPLTEASPRIERADAARNRALILAAARELFGACGAEAVSMDEIAERAGVGKGTLYRRFQGKADLALALLDDDDRRFQEHLIRGAPPLGPGAPPRERLHAFGSAYQEFLERHAVLLSAADGARGLRNSPPWQVYRTHLVVVLSDAAPQSDTELGAEMLLDTLRPAVYHARRQAGFTRERLEEGWRLLVDGWLAVAAR